MFENENQWRKAAWWHQLSWLAKEENGGKWRKWRISNRRIVSWRRNGAGALGVSMASNVSQYVNICTSMLYISMAVSSWQKKMPCNIMRQYSLY
jgi:hypothetical protein